MRDHWYGDKRDLIKWGTLLELSRRFRIEHVLQVLFQRPSTWGSLNLDGESVPLPLEVRQHFRNATNIRSLCQTPRVEVIETEFVDRANYFKIVQESLDARSPARTSIVFLDPDTGLQPSGSLRAEHVSEAEVRGVWQRMRPGDVIVLYQHQTNRTGAPWIEPKQIQLANALSLDRSAVKVAAAPAIARDVVLLFAARNDSNGPGVRSQTSN